MKRLLVVGLMCGACGEVPAPKVDAKLSDSPLPSDTGLPVDAAPPRCDPSKPFGTPTVVPNINSAQTDFTPFLTPDELQIWFGSNRTGSSDYDIWWASRASITADFGPPQLASGVNTAGQDTRPTLTADGLTIYIQYLASPTATYQITSATRASTTAAFGGPTEVAALASTSFDDANFVLPDHSAVYFLSGRSGGAKIFRSARTGGVLQAPVLADGVDLNADNNDYPTVLADDKKIYFLSSRTGGVGGTDNWMASRSSPAVGFGAAVNVAELNQTDGYNIQFVTADDCIAYLSGPGNGGDIYVAKKPL